MNPAVSIQVTPKAAATFQTKSQRKITTGPIHPILVNFGNVIDGIARQINGSTSTGNAWQQRRVPYSMTPLKEVSFAI